jgi:hypothetical protein
MVRLFIVIWLICFEPIASLTKWCKSYAESCHIDDFERISEINIVCDMNIAMPLLDLWPNKRLVFDESIKNVNCSVRDVFLNNIRAFHSNTSILLGKQVNFLNVYNSEFKFIYDADKFEQVFFSNNSIRLVKFDREVKYFTNTPTIIFKDAQIYYLTFYDMVDTAIKKNYLTFQKSLQVSYLNSQVKNLDFYLFKVKLDNRLLDADVFEKVEKISISNQIEQIEVETFKPFKYLRHLTFNLYSVSDFIQKTGTVWMRNLNSPVKVDYKNGSELTVEKQFFLVLEPLYAFLKYKPTFPEEDFCLYKDFPHENYVLLISSECRLTCTFMWLIQYFEFFQASLIPTCYISIANATSCDFSAMLDLCLIQDDDPQVKTEYEKIDFYSLNDANYKNKQYDFWISICLIPLFSFYGIVVNALNIIVLSNKHLKINKNNKMYEQMLLGSYANFFICMIYLFGLTIKCIDPIGGYCVLPLIVNKKYRYFALTIYVYIGSVLRTCSKLIQIIIALDRFILSTDNKNKLLLRISAFSVRKFLTFSLIFSLLVNVVKLFQFNYQLKYQLDETFRYPVLFKYYFNFYFLYAYFNVLNILLNNCMFLAFELIIYFKMLHYVHQSIRNKIKLLGSKKMNNNSENLRAEKNIKRMIILSCLIMFVLHLPDLIISIWLAFTFSGLEYQNSSLNIFSFILNGISELCYIISYTLNFFIYFYFNSLFKQCFNRIFFIKDSNSKNFDSSIHSGNKFEKN